MQKFFNCTVEQEGDELVVRINLKGTPRESGSKKTMTRATTGKPKEIWIEGEDQPSMLGVNFFQYPNPK